MNRTTLAGLVVAVLLTVLVLLGLTVFRRQVHGAWQMALDAGQMRRDLAEGKRFPQALAAAKAQGLPTTMAELQKPLPPPERNAAPIYVRLMLLLKARPFTKTEDAAMTLHSGVTPSAAQWAQISQLLHDRAGVMALVHQAASRPNCVFTRGWANNNPADIAFPEMTAVRQATRLLELESLLMAHQGRFELAAQNQVLGFRVARHGANDGTLIAYLLGLGVDAITLDGLKRIMTLAGPNAALDDTVGMLIVRDWKPGSLSAALRSEVAFQQSIIAYLRKTGPRGLQTINSDLSAEGIGQGNWNAVLDYNGVFLLGQMECAIHSADGPYTDAHRVLSQVEAQCTDRRHNSRFIAAMVVPTLAETSGKGPEVQAISDVTRAGAAVLSRIAHTGHPPDRLPVAVMDRYTGKPLGYRREGAQGFVIYSAGASGRFDGGRPGEYHWTPYQVAFRYPGVAAVPTPPQGYKPDEPAAIPARVVAASASHDGGRDESRYRPLAEGAYRERRFDDQPCCGGFGGGPRH